MEFYQSGHYWPSAAAHCPAHRQEKMGEGFPTPCLRYAVHLVTEPFTKNQPILDTLKDPQ